MRTLIFNGSPRINGNTSSLVAALKAGLCGDVKIVRAYDCNVKACIDCRYCWEHDGCSQKDGMQEIYGYIQECDNIVIASPMQFTEISGQLLAVLSRLQTYWSARFFRKTEPVEKKKLGGIIVVGGANLPVRKAEDTAKVLLREMNAAPVITIYSKNTNEIDSINDLEVMAGIEKMAQALNRKQ
jgi:multimeric flavodoxin WrbA